MRQELYTHESQLHLPYDLSYISLLDPLDIHFTHY
jgi:hypothetical protein